MRLRAAERGKEGGVVMAYRLGDKPENLVRAAEVVAYVMKNIKNTIFPIDNEQPITASCQRSEEMANE